MKRLFIWRNVNETAETTLSQKTLMDITSNTEHKEGPVAKGIEKQTAKIPSDIFLWAALGSIGVSLALKIAGKRHNALFVGQWAAPFLLLGLYNKLVKLEGSDNDDKE